MATARPVTVSTPLGDEVLLLRRMYGTEELGRLFEFELDLLSEDEQLSFEAILGQNLTVSLALPDEETRYFNGYASRFRQVGREGRFALYRATLRPWFWFLTRTADCRIFQDMTVPDMLKEVFREHGFTDFEEALSGSYRTWEYCVQYRETDFNFLSRLMEQEGIYYYFKHADGKHTLVLADSYSSHDRLPGAETIPYYPPSENVIRAGHIFEWSICKELQPGKYALTDYDFERPRADLAASQPFARSHDKADFEVYDYPGEYLDLNQGQTYARLRIEEHQAQYERVEGRGTEGRLAVGGLFELGEYPRSDQNREYLVVSAVYEISAGEFESGAAAAGEEPYQCSFAAMDSQQPYRTPRTTPKPAVQGPQTAVVVGKAGEEIWTDQYGRVKVQFHWDRVGASDENSSCWVRVAQVWAGKSWGGIHIPRMGQEVIVEFLEGDPDRPIITGRVYNADQMPPYALPDNATQSGIKSRSSKGGSGENFNEIRFEDKAGAEEMYIHAEKDRTIVVEADETHDVGANRTRSVGADESVTVGGKRTKKVGADETVTIAAKKDETIGANSTLTVGADQATTVGASKTETVAANKTMSVGGSEVCTVAGPVSLNIGGSKTETVAGMFQATVGAEHNTKLGVFSEFTGGAKMEQIAGLKKEIMGGLKMEVFGGVHISIAAGAKIEKGPLKQLLNDVVEIKSSKVKIQAGDITLQGHNITIKGDSVKIEGATKFTDKIDAPNFKAD